MEFKHKSVLLEETVGNLKVKPDGIYVDGTLGGGGHSYRICQQLSAKGSLIGIDQDEAAIKAAGERLQEFKDQVTIIRSNYCNMKRELHKIGITSVDGIILDLGVSSYQLDNSQRGFTYREDVPLDMRMDQRNPRTARDIVNDYSEQELYRIIRDYGEDKFAKNIAKHICLARQEKSIETTGTARDIVNDYSEQELYRIIRDYGEDKFAKNIAKHICLARQEKSIETTGELSEIIKRAIPMKMRAVGGHPAKKTFQAIRIELNQELDVLRNTLDDMIDLLNDKRAIPMKMRAVGGHPAKKTFQAIRIELNQELDVLRNTLDDMIDLLNENGRICIITFHSLEDRIVKTIFKQNENPCTCPPGFPVCVCGNVSKGRVITRKPILPSEEELEVNPRSKSAKLRVFERVKQEQK